MKKKTKSVIETVDRKAYEIMTQYIQTLNTIQMR